MTKQEKKEQSSLPPCPDPQCAQPHVVRNGSHRGRPRYQCRTCKTYFGDTQVDRFVLLSDRSTLKRLLDWDQRILGSVLLSNLDRGPRWR